MLPLVGVVRPCLLMGAIVGQEGPQGQAGCRSHLAQSATRMLAALPPPCGGALAPRGLSALAAAPRWFPGVACLQRICCSAHACPLCTPPSFAAAPGSLLDEMYGGGGGGPGFPPDPWDLSGEPKSMLLSRKQVGVGRQRFTDAGLVAGRLAVVFSERGRLAAACCLVLADLLARLARAPVQTIYIAASLLILVADTPCCRR